MITEMPSREDIAGMGVAALKGLISHCGCQSHKDDMVHIIGTSQYSSVQYVTVQLSKFVSIVLISYRVLYLYVCVCLCIWLLR